MSPPGRSAAPQDNELKVIRLVWRLLYVPGGHDGRGHDLRRRVLQERTLSIDPDRDQARPHHSRHDGIVSTSRRAVNAATISAGWCLSWIRFTDRRLFKASSERCCSSSSFSCPPARSATGKGGCSWEPLPRRPSVSPCIWRSTTDRSSSAE